MDMTQGKTTKQLVTFAFPLMLGSMLQHIYILTDAAIIGKFLGYQALASVGSADWLSWLFTSMINGLTMGFCAKVSQDKGTRDQHKLYTSSAMCILLAVGFAVFFLLLGQIIAKPALILLKTPSDIIDNSIIYLRILYFAAPITLFYNTIAAILRANGDSKTPFIAMLISAIANVGMDWLLVVGLNKGVESAAIATAIAQGISLFICLLKFLKTKEVCFTKSYLRPERSVIASILKQSLPPSLQFFIVASSGLVIQYLTNKQGSIFLAGYTAANKYYGVVEMAAIAVASALLTYSGQNYGAHNIFRIKKGIRSGLLLSAIASIIVTLIMVLCGKPLLAIFINAQPDTADEIMGYAYQFLMFLSLPLYLLYLHHTLRSVLQGIGDYMTPLISGIMQGSFRVISAFVLTHFIGKIGVFAAEPCAWVGSVLFLTIRLIYVVKKKLNSLQE